MFTKNDTEQDVYAYDVAEQMKMHGKIRGYNVLALKALWLVLKCPGKLHKITHFSNSMGKERSFERYARYKKELPELKREYLECKTGADRANVKDKIDRRENFIAEYRKKFGNKER